MALSISALTFSPSHLPIHALEWLSSLGRMQGASEFSKEQTPRQKVAGTQWARPLQASLPPNLALPKISRFIQSPRLVDLRQERS